MELSFEPFAQVASVSDQTQARLYYRRFVETQFAVYGYGHMVFAAYAAVPALLTPDLLYKLWQNFSNYEWQAKSRHIHRIAVSDVLLHLCEDLGQELYEMPPGLKLALLDWLNKESQDENDLNLSSPQQIAQFVIAYHENPSSGFQRHGLGYEDLQLWTAQHVLDPEYAYNKVYEALRSKLDSPDEFLRLLELWDQLRLNGQALGYALTPDQENLAALKPSWKALIQEDSMALQQELQHLAGRSDLRQYLQPAKGTQLLGLSIPARLQSVVQEMVSSIVQESVVLETEVADGPSIHGILIGVGRAEGREDWPVWDDVWAVQEYFAELCQSQGVNWKPHILLDSREQIPEKELSWVSIERPLYEASTENVDQVVQQILTLPSHPQDVLLIYYQGVHHSRYLQLKNQTLDLNDYLHLTNRLPCFLLFEGFELDDDLNMQSEELQKPFVQFRATHAIQQGLNQVIDGKKRAPFTHFFLEVLREGGFQRSYSEVFYRSEFLAHNLLPQLRCTSTYYNLDYKTAFLNGTLADTGFQYLLEYGGEGSWSLNAGKNRGITPSSDFMQTIVRAEDGREFIIGDVYENRALIKQKVEWLGQSRPGAIPVTLLQTAIPRMKIAFEPGIAKQARADLEEAIARHRIYYVEFVDNADEARFFIRFLEGKRFALFNQLSSRLNPREEEYPLFLPVEDSYLFIVQIEHIAKWYGVLEFDNLRGTLPKESIGWEVETFTGESNTPQLHNSPRQVALYYENGQKPRLGCKVVNQSAQALFVSCIYLDASFEITNAPLHPERIEPGREVWLFEKEMGARVQKIGIPEVVEQFKKAEDVTEFIKFFVSEQYFTPEAFEQSAIRTEVFRNVNFERSNVFRGFEGGDWTSVVVPVVIDPYITSGDWFAELNKQFINNLFEEVIHKLLNYFNQQNDRTNREKALELANSERELVKDWKLQMIHRDNFYLKDNQIRYKLSELLSIVRGKLEALNSNSNNEIDTINEKTQLSLFQVLKSQSLLSFFQKVLSDYNNLPTALNESLNFLYSQFLKIQQDFNEGTINWEVFSSYDSKIYYRVANLILDPENNPRLIKIQNLNSEHRHKIKGEIEKLSSPNNGVASQNYSVALMNLYALLEKESLVDSLELLRIIKRDQFLKSIFTSNIINKSQYESERNKVQKSAMVFYDTLFIQLNENEIFNHKTLNRLRELISSGDFEIALRVTNLYLLTISQLNLEKLEQLKTKYDAYLKQEVQFFRRKPYFELVKEFKEIKGQVASGENFVRYGEFELLFEENRIDEALIGAMNFLHFRSEKRQVELAKLKEDFFNLENQQLENLVAYEVYSSLLEKNTYALLGLITDLENEGI